MCCGWFQRLWCGGRPFLAWFFWRCACAAGLRCCFLPDFCSGEPHRADVACWGGWGPHTPCARQIGPHPPQPTPPSRHGSLRYVWVRRQKCGVPFSVLRCRRSQVRRLRRQRVKKSWIEMAGAHGIVRTRGEPFRQSLLAVCGGRLTPCLGAERSNDPPPGRPTASQSGRSLVTGGMPESPHPTSPARTVGMVVFFLAVPLRAAQNGGVSTRPSALTHATLAIPRRPPHPHPHCGSD